MTLSRTIRALAALSLLVPASPLAAQAPAPADTALTGRLETEYQGATGLGLLLRRLGPTGRVLMIGAHPDDEDTQLLARLALGDGADVAYLSLTRGEGGQNAIGADFQEALGIIRTEELLAARRADGARQFFGRAYDYGFSKSADEAFRHWPRDSVLADVVRVIRAFRPDAVVSVFTGTPRDGHGQHQAAGILAKEAFASAGDAARFPAQVRAGLRPWQPRKLYEGGYFRQDSLTTRYPTGVPDPLLGTSHAVLATISRGRHRSQSLGRLLPLGPRNTGVNLVEDRGNPAPVRPERSIFQGIDTTLSARAAATLGSNAPVSRLLAAYDEAAATARAVFNPLTPDTLVPALLRAASLLHAADSTLAQNAAGAELRWYVQEELLDVTAALLAAHGLVLDATSTAEQVAPGAAIEVTRSVWNGGRRPVTWRIAADSAIVVATGALATHTLRLAAPDRVTEPYFLRTPRQGDVYAWPTANGVAGLPFEPPLSLPFDLELDDVAVRWVRELTYRAVDPVDGESRRPVRVVPPVSVRMERTVAVRPLASTEPLSLAVRVAAETDAPVTGELRLELPAGWSADRAAVPLQLAAGDARTVNFQVRPPAGLRPASHAVTAVFRDSAGGEHTRGFQLIDYPHIRPRPLYSDARTRVELVDLVVPAALRQQPVGYIMGPGDDVPAALAQLGIAVEQLAPEALAGNGANLARYGTILVGVRAFDAGPELGVANRRLLDWARDGGTLLVQYQQGWAEAGLPPYPMALGRPADRVTDEHAPVTVLDPAAAVFNAPNRITAADWEGWVQERGLYFPRTWDSNWRPLLELNDPGEAPLRGALLVAPYGRGTVIYTGLSFFRQLPAGVPGAYRLFVNLLALGTQSRGGI